MTETPTTPPQRIPLVALDRLPDEMREHLPALADELGIGGSGSGIEVVSGTVTLDPAEGFFHQVYATAAATVEREKLSAGEMAMFRYISGGWQVIAFDVNGAPKDAQWRPVAAAPAIDLDPPKWPAGASITAAATATDVTLTLGALAQDDRGVSAYEVSLDNGASWLSTATGTRVTLTGKTLKITSLTPGADYPAPRIRARDAAGNLSALLTAATGFTTSAVVLTQPLTADLSGPADTLLTGRTIGQFTWNHLTTTLGNLVGYGPTAAQKSLALTGANAAGKRGNAYLPIGTNKLDISMTYKGMAPGDLGIGIGDYAAAGKSIYVRSLASRTGLAIAYPGQSQLTIYPSTGTAGASNSLPADGTIRLMFDGTNVAAWYNGSLIHSGTVSGPVGTNVGFMIDGDPGTITAMSIAPAPGA